MGVIEEPRVWTLANTFGRNNSVNLEATQRESVLRPVDDHGPRTKIVEGNDAFIRGGERSGNRQIVQVGNVPLTADINRVDLCSESLAYLRGCAGEVDGHTARAWGRDCESVGTKPCTDGGDILGCDAELLGVLVSGKPMMELASPRLAPDRRPMFRQPAHFQGASQL
jgi:hypothetical protein